MKKEKKDIKFDTPQAPAPDAGANMPPEIAGPEGLPGWNGPGPGQAAQAPPLKRPISQGGGSPMSSPFNSAPEMMDMPKRPEPDVEEDEKDPKMRAFKEFGLNPQQVEAWKRDYGFVGLSVLGPKNDEFFVWRPLFADEFLEVQSALDRLEDAAQSGGKMISRQREYHKLLLNRCLLWNNQESVRQKAGTMQTVASQIERASNYYSPEEAIFRTVAL